MDQRRNMLGVLVGLVVLSTLIPQAAAEHGEEDTRGLVAFWQFDETAGGLGDSSGNELHGMLHDDIERGVQGANNSTAYRFDGTDDWVGVDDSPFFGPYWNVSIEAWFRPDTLSPDTAMRIMQRAPKYTYGFYINSYGGLVFAVDAFQTGGGWRAAGYDLPVADRWYHAVGTYDNRTIRLYVDGELVDTQPQSGLTGKGLADNPFGIAAQGNEKQYFDGMIDEMRVYNRTLSDTAVQKHYENPPGWHPMRSAGDTQEVTDNETEDSGSGDGEDNETATGNETTGEDEASADNETGNGSLFTGGDGTTEPEEGGTGNETAEGSNMTDGADTSTVDTDENTSATDSDDERGAGREETLTVLPTHITVSLTPGAGSERSVTVTNTGDDSVDAYVTLLGLSAIGSVTDRRSTVAPGEEHRFPISFRIDPGISPGRYAGMLRVETSKIVRSIPVDIHVREPDGKPQENDTADATVPDRPPTIRFESVERDAGRMTGTVRIRAPPDRQTRYELVSRVYSNEGFTLVYEDRSNVSGTGNMTVDLALDERFADGNYTWTIRVDAGGYAAGDSRTLVGRSAGRQGGGLPLTLLAIVVAAVSIGVAYQYRGRVLERIEGVVA